MTRREAMDQMMARLDKNKRSGILSEESYEAVVELLPTLETDFIRWCFISDLIKIAKENI